MHEWLDTRCARAQLGRPDVQETGGTLDPQRQHAQLLGLWSQGSKLVRRLEHRGYGETLQLEFVERWWNIARQLSERGLTALVLPLRPPVLLVAYGFGKTRWVTLVDRAGVESFDPTIYHHLLTVDFGEGPALYLGAERSVLSDQLLLRLSVKTLATMAELSERHSRAVTVEAVPDALVVLAAWHHVPEAMARVDEEDWIPAATLWRHRGHGLDLHRDLVERYPFLIARGDDGRQRWLAGNNPG